MSPTGDLDLLVLSQTCDHRDDDEGCYSASHVDESFYVFNYFENIGTSTTPVFVQRTGSANPFDGINIGEILAPAFADIDGDSTLRPCPLIRSDSKSHVSVARRRPRPRSA